MSKDSYRQAGVDIDAGQRAVSLMKSAVEGTYNSNVLSNTGNFGGLFAISHLKEMDDPILVASTDGVGTKTKVAAKLNKWETIGQDLVNHCVNDILVQGAKPLFFLDYVASSKLNSQQIADIVIGMAAACQSIDVAILGGETAEMPGVYMDGEVDVVGTIVGVVDRQNLLDGSIITSGDSVISLPSSGLHTNGFSLARHALKNEDWTQYRDDLGASIGDALLMPHRCYLPEIEQLNRENIAIKGLAHITGGGVIDNLPRILPEGLGATINLGSWDVQPIFNIIQQLGDVDLHEMYRVFNMGLGMLVVLEGSDAEKVLSLHPEASVVGEIIAGNGVTLK